MKAQQGEPLPLFPTAEETAQDAFDAFWAVYPRHVAKAAARRAWDAVLRRADPQAVVTAAAEYARECAGKDPKFVAHPATWLNGGRWEDEAAPPVLPRPKVYDWANAEPDVAVPCAPEDDWRRFM